MSLRASRQPRGNAAGDSTAARWPELVVLGVALATSLPGILNDFVYDDIPIVRDNVRVHDLSNLVDAVSRPYWPPPFVEQLYRPVSTFLITLQYVVGGGSPLAFRVVSCALYAACALGVYRLAARLLSREAALFAAVLFAAHPVHVEAVALGVNQGELIVGGLAVLMVSRYLRARAHGSVSVKEWAILACLYAIAALAKENGYVLPALLVAAELTIVSDGRLLERARALWRGYAALALVGITLLLVRAWVLRDSAVAAIAAHDLRGLSLGDRMLIMLQVVPQWARLFVWPAHLQVDYAPGEIALPSALGIAEYSGLFLAAFVLVAIYLTRRRAPVLSFGLWWCVIGLLPVSNIIPAGILLAERTLFLPSIGVVLAMGALVDLATQRWPSATALRTLAAFGVLLTALGVGRSISRQLVWNSEHLRIVTRPTAR